MRAVRGLVLLCAALALVAAVWAAPARDVLWDLVAHCVQGQGPDYCSACRAPRADAGCGAPPSCRASTEVWALQPAFVALRDIRMCGCPAGFVHGLALPRTPVRGVEDPLRPDAIWQFAWDAAQARIEPTSIALVVNPQSRRSQDQLHVHLLRLQDGARADLDAGPGAPVAALAQVWAAAAGLAQAQGLDDYGVLVYALSAGGWRVAAMADSPEARFTRWRCD